MTWFLDNPNRLSVERISLNRFPNFHFVKSGDRLAVKGQLKTTRNNFYDLIIYYPEDYPYSCPLAYMENPQIDLQSPHRYKDNRLCIEQDNWSTNYTIATVIGWVAHWLHAYDYWKIHKQWLGKQA